MENAIYMGQSTYVGTYFFGSDIAKAPISVPSQGFRDYWYVNGEAELLPVLSMRPFSGS